MEAAVTCEETGRWIDQSRRGDRDAFARLVRRYQGMVSGVALSQTGDVHQSEDLAQETFLLAWQKLAELDDPQKFPGWICSIARNLARNAVRKKSESERTGTPIEAESQSVDPVAPLVTAEQNAIIGAALERIPEDYREPLVLFYRGEQSTKQIAAALEITEGNARQRLSRARKYLRREIERIIGDVLSDTAPGEAFTLTVMTALGAVMVSNTAHAAVAAATGAVVSTVAGTGSAATGKTLGIAAFWAVLGPVVFYTWLFSILFRATWLDIRNAPTLRARRFRIDCCFQTAAWIFPYMLGITLISMAVSLFISRFLPPRFPDVVPVLIPLLMIFFASAFVLKRNKTRVRIYKAIIENDLGISETRVASPSYRNIENRLYQAMIVTTLLVETLLGGVLLLPLVDASAPWYYSGILLGIATVTGGMLYGYYRFGRRLLEMGRSPERFLATPPLIENPFETALGRSAARPAGFGWKTKTGKAYGIWCWIGLGSLFFWGISWLNWNDHPLRTAGCLVALVLGWIVSDRYGKRIVSKRNACFLGAGIFLYMSPILVALAMLECNTTSLFVVWQSAVHSPRNLVAGTLLLYIAVAPITFLLQLTRGLLAPPGEMRQGATENLEYVVRLHEAIKRYVPRDVANPADGEPTCFPKIWLKVFAGYGIVFLLLFVVASLFPLPAARKAMLLRNGDYTSLIQIEPNNPEYYFKRGCREQVPEKAIEDFDTAIRLKPDYAEAYMARADARNRWQQPLEVDAMRRLALADADEAVRLDPKNARYYQQRASIQALLGNLDTAEADHTAAIQRKPNSWYYWARGNFFDYWRKDAVKAVDDFTVAIRCAEREKLSSPSGQSEYPIEWLYRERAELYEKLGESDKAQADRKKAK